MFHFGFGKNESNCNIIRTKYKCRYESNRFNLRATVASQIRRERIVCNQNVFLSAYLE